MSKPRKETGEDEVKKSDDLIKSNSIDTDIALSMYDKCEKIVQDNLKDKKNKVYGADEISEELEKLLIPILNSKDLANDEKYSRLDSGSQLLRRRNFTNAVWYSRFLLMLCRIPENNKRNKLLFKPVKVPKLSCYLRSRKI